MTIDHDSATDIAKTLDVLQVLRWIGAVWSKVENDTIIKCFAAAGISSTFSEAANMHACIHTYTLFPLELSE